MPGAPTGAPKERPVLGDAALFALLAPSGTVVAVTDDARDASTAWGSLLTPRRRSVPRNLEGPPGSTCPFCPGSDVEERIVAQLPAGGHWRSCTIANAYPIVEPGSAGALSGRHEVLVCSPDHHRHLDELGREDGTRALRLMMDRFAHLGLDWPTVLGFFNRGRAAGASQVHPHGQVVALSGAVPSLVAEQGALRRGCPFCVVEPALVVARTPRFLVQVAKHPHASYEVLIAPRAHGGSFASSSACAEELFEVVHATLRAVLPLASTEAFNLVIHDRDDCDFHWHVHLIPRLGTLGGFEYASGLFLIWADPYTVAHDLGAAVARELAHGRALFGAALEGG